jgi:hypothetical protein
MRAKRDYANRTPLDVAEREIDRGAGLKMLCLVDSNRQIVENFLTRHLLAPPLSPS